MFYLPEPPQGFETLRDFRRLDPTQSGEWSAALHAEYRRAHFQRDALLEIAELGQQELPTDWRLTRVPRGDADLSVAARANLMSIVAQKGRPRPPPANTTTSDTGREPWRTRGCS